MRHPDPPLPAPHHPVPPPYFAEDQLNEICQSYTFAPNELMKFLLMIIVRRTVNGQVTTEDVLAQLWRTAEPEKVYEEVGDLWQKVRVAVSNLRKLIHKYYNSMDAQTALLVISVPRAGVDEASRKVTHYKATFAFNPIILRTVTHFANVMHYKYDLPVEEGETWFETGREAPSMFDCVDRKRHNYAALLFLFGALVSPDESFEQASKWSGKWPLETLYLLTQRDGFWRDVSTS